MKCKKCNQDKSIDEFYKVPDTRSGRRGSCIKCVKDHNKAMYWKDPERFRLEKKEYRRQRKQIRRKYEL